MKISDAIDLMTSVVEFNITQYEKAIKSGSTRAFEEFVVPYFEGPPGIGKTAIPRQAAARLDIPYFQTIVAQYDSGEMGGLSFRGPVEYPTIDEKTGQINSEKMATFDRSVRLRPEYLPDIDDPRQRIGIYNLDELPQSFPANMNICSQIVNEYRVGKHNLSQGLTLCGTGNRVQDKAGTHPMPRHLKDRLMFIPIEVDHDDWYTNAARSGFDPRVTTFIKQNPKFLLMNDPAADANPSPRSWGKVSATMQMNMSNHVRFQAIKGQVGEAATTFETWLRVEEKMPKIEDILANPKTAKIFGPKDADVIYLLLTNLAEIASPKNIQAQIEYVTRFEQKEFMMMWGKEILLRRPELKTQKDFGNWIMMHAQKMMI